MDNYSFCAYEIVLAYYWALVEPECLMTSHKVTIRHELSLGTEWYLIHHSMKLGIHGNPLSSKEIGKYVID
jgi:hypothetical protein